MRHWPIRDSVWSAKPRPLLPPVSCEAPFHLLALWSMQCVSIPLQTQRACSGLACWNYWQVWRVFQVESQEAKQTTNNCCDPILISESMQIKCFWSMSNFKETQDLKIAFSLRRKAHDLMHSSFHTYTKCRHKYFNIIIVWFILIFEAHRNKNVFSTAKYNFTKYNFN